MRFKVKKLILLTVCIGFVFFLFSCEEVTSVEDNDTFETSAIVTADGISVYDEFTRSDTIDYFRFEGAQGSTYTINFIPGIYEVRVNITLYRLNDSLQYEEVMDNSAGSPYQFTFSCTSTEMYFLEMEMADNLARANYSVAVIEN